MHGVTVAYTIQSNVEIQPAMYGKNEKASTEPWFRTWSIVPIGARKRPHAANKPSHPKMISLGGWVGHEAISQRITTQIREFFFATQNRNPW